MPSRKLVLVVLCLVLCLLAPWLKADTEGLQQSPKVFEVASIKRNKDVTTLATSGALPGGQFIMTNSPFQRAILFAYPVDSRELIGAPSWVLSEKYDITAIGTPGANRRDIEEMLRNLLAERLQLRVHSEQRQRPIYSLRVARRDGRLGPNLVRQPSECTRADAPQTANPTAQNGAPLCGFSTGMGTMRAGGLPMAQIARGFSYDAGRVVVDKTGLAGTYEFTLEYALRSAPASDDRSDFFTAVREQLGLQLIPEEGPLEVLVVDRIMRPTDD